MTVSDGPLWTVRLSATVMRDLNKVPTRSRAALVVFIFDGIGAAPQRRGKPLRGDFSGSWSARREDWRVIYRLDLSSRVVLVDAVLPRADAYRPR